MPEPKDWIPEPVFDSSDYLDGELPRYAEEDEATKPDEEENDDGE